MKSNAFLECRFISWLFLSSSLQKACPPERSGPCAKKYLQSKTVQRGYLSHLQTISLKKLPLCYQTAHMNELDNLRVKNCHPTLSSLQWADSMRVIQIICRKIVIKECPLCNQTANMKDPDDLKEKSSHLQQFSLPMASQLYASYESCLSQSRLS